MLPILDEFVAASKGKSNRDFWADFYKQHIVGCNNPNVNGHLIHLFPYLPSVDNSVFQEYWTIYSARNRSAREELEQWAAHSKPSAEEYEKRAALLEDRASRTAASGFRRNPDVEHRIGSQAELANPRILSTDQLDNLPHLVRPKVAQGSGPDTFPSSLSYAPFTLTDRDEKQYPMQFVAGFVGASQDETTLAIRPEIGWAVREVPA